jgi:hypothetical protein
MRKQTMAHLFNRADQRSAGHRALPIPATRGSPGDFLGDSLGELLGDPMGDPLGDSLVAPLGHSPEDPWGIPLGTPWDHAGSIPGRFWVDSESILVRFCIDSA